MRRVTAQFATAICTTASLLCHGVTIPAVAWRCRERSSRTPSNVPQIVSSASDALRRMIASAVARRVCADMATPQNNDLFSLRYASRQVLDDLYSFSRLGARQTERVPHEEDGVNMLSHIAQNRWYGAERSREQDF